MADRAASPCNRHTGAQPGDLRVRAHAGDCDCVVRETRAQRLAKLAPDTRKPATPKRVASGASPLSVRKGTSRVVPVVRPSRRSGRSRMSEHPVAEPREDGNLLMALANEMVRLTKEQFGRGPTSARAVWAGPDVLLVILEETFTPRRVQSRPDGRARAVARNAHVLPIRERARVVRADRAADGPDGAAFISGIDT